MTLTLYPNAETEQVSWYRDRWPARTAQEKVVWRMRFALSFPGHNTIIWGKS